MFSEKKIIHTSLAPTRYFCFLYMYVYQRDQLFNLQTFKLYILYCQAQLKKNLTNTNLILITTWEGRCFCYPHFIDEETCGGEPFCVTQLVDGRAEIQTQTVSTVCTFNCHVLLPSVEASTRQIFFLVVWVVSTFPYFLSLPL